MATLLSTAFREAIKATKDIAQINEMNYSVGYPTGYIPLDYATGFVQDVNGHLKIELGITDGSINTLIGDPGTGKTSLIIPMARNIIAPFQTSTIFLDQAEVGTHVQRIKDLTGFGEAGMFMGRMIARDAGITTESIYKRVKVIYNEKVSHPEKYLYDTGMVDMLGNKIYKFEPTIYIVDSLKLVFNDANTAVEATTNMTGAQNAKSNTEYYGQMAPMCRVANIIMILVNHIQPRVQTGPMPQKSEFPFLKQNEHLPAGRLVQYISNTMMRLDIMTKLKADDDFGIAGTMVNIDMVKCRTNKSGKARCALVFDESTGFDPDLSALFMLASNKLLSGSGNGYMVGDCPIKFTKKTFKKKLYEDPEFYKAFNRFCFDYIKTNLIEEYKHRQEEVNRQFSQQSSYNAIIDMFKEDYLNQLNATNAAA